jgi:hypothetical protein
MSRGEEAACQVEVAVVEGKSSKVPRPAKFRNSSKKPWLKLTCAHARRRTPRGSRVSTASLRAQLEAAKQLSHDILQAKHAMADPWLGLDLDGLGARGQVAEANAYGARPGSGMGGTRKEPIAGYTGVRAKSRSGRKGTPEVCCARNLRLQNR